MSQTDLALRQQQQLDFKPKASVFRHSNAFINATYKLSTNEKRLVYMSLDKIIRGKFTRDEYGAYEVDIYHSEFATRFNTGITNAKRDVAVAVKQLITREVVFYLSNESAEEDRNLTSHNWTVGRGQNPKKGLTQIRFNPAIIAIITDKNHGFSDLLKSDISKLSNFNTMRLYDSLCAWKRAGKVRFNVDWIIQRYELPQSYARMSDFRRRILNPAMEEINNNTHLTVSYQEVIDPGTTYNTRKMIDFIIVDNVAGTVPDEELDDLDIAAKTYAQLLNRDDLPTAAELANFKNYTAELIANGFVFDNQILQGIKDAESCIALAAAEA